MKNFHFYGVKGAGLSESECYVVPVSLVYGIVCLLVST